MSILRVVVKTVGILAAKTVATEGLRLAAEHAGNRLGHDHIGSRLLGSAHAITQQYTGVASAPIEYTGEYCEQRASADFANKDYDAALSWALMGIKKRSTGCMLIMGMAFQNGHGVIRNIRTAGEWYIRAFDAGERKYSASLMLGVGTGYALGEQVEKNVPLAIEVFHFVSQNADPESAGHARDWLRQLKQPLTING